MGHFREGRQTLLTSLFFSAGGTSGKVDLPAEAQRADIFLALNASTVELADLGGWVGGWVGGCGQQGDSAAGLGWA